MKTFHPFHIVNQSPWPLTGALGALTMMAGMIFMFSKASNILMFFGILILTLTMLAWWRDISRESTMQGHHSFLVTTGMRWGMILFIASEVLFFLSFFN